MAEICDQNFDVLCRLCLNHIEGDFVPIFDNEPLFHTASVQDKIYFITAILVSPEDPLPAQICGLCDDRVNDCYTFKQQTAVNNLKLLKYVQQQKESSKNSSSPQSPPMGASLRFHKRSPKNGGGDEDSLSDSPSRYLRSPKSGLTNGNHATVPGDSPARKRKHEDDSSEGDSRKGSPSKELNEVIATRVAVVRAGKVKQTSPITSLVGDPTKEPENVEEAIKSEPKLKKSRVLWTMRTRGKAQKRFRALGYHLKPSRLDDESNADADDIFKYLRLNEVSRVATMKKEAEEIALLQEMAPAGKERKCPECGERFATLADLRDHKGATGHTIPSCPTCGKTFLTLEVRDNHVLKKHKGGKEPKAKKTKERRCHECGMICDSLPELRDHQHKEGHQLAPVCKICGIIYKSFEAREKHILKRHKGQVDVSGKINFVCSVAQCKKSFKTSAFLASHVAQHHTSAGPRKYACELCDQRFVFTKDLRAHFEAAHDTDTQLFQCLFCDATLTSSKALRSHFNRLHKPERRMDELKYTCATCLQMFGTKATLNAHMRTHKVERFELDPQRLHKLYECEVCGVPFKYKTAKKNHVLKCHSTEDDLNVQTVKKVSEVVNIRVNKKKIKRHSYAEDPDF